MSLETGSAFELSPLNDDTLESAIGVAERSFMHDTSPVRPGHWFRASLYPDDRRILEGIADEKVGAHLQYWVATLGKRIVGTTGLYSDEADHPDALWVGWFCLENAPEVRGHGYGRQMLDFTIDQARAAGAKELKLYTSDLHEEAAAQYLYEKAGLVIVGTERHRLGYNLLYRRLLLS